MSESNLSSIGGRRATETVKTVFDTVSTILAIILLLPLLIVIALLIRREGGPVLFAHPRIGRNGKTFNCLKFRTMVVNAEAVLSAHLETDAEAAREWAHRRKLERDPRLTSIGRFLRQTSLDELPQLLNVARGDMSVVGPRPIVTAELSRYGSQVDHYLAMRPGITGLWQVSGRSNTSYEERVALDVEYVENWSIGLDVKIMLKTVPALIRRDGAI